jgi:hypothetical protein
MLVITMTVADCRAADRKEQTTRTSELRERTGFT